MKQKADHHLEFLADRTERNAAATLSLPPAYTNPSRQLSAAPSSHVPLQPSPLGISSQLPGGDEDAAGESDDGGIADSGGRGDFFQQEAGAGPQSHTAANDEQGKTGQTISGKLTQPVHGVS